MEIAGIAPANRGEERRRDDGGTRANLQSGRDSTEEMTDMSDLDRNEAQETLGWRFCGFFSGERQVMCKR